MRNQITRPLPFVFLVGPGNAQRYRWVGAIVTTSIVTYRGMKMEAADTKPNKKEKSK
jgi:hypothetical protein